MDGGVAAEGRAPAFSRTPARSLGRPFLQLEAEIGPAGHADAEAEVRRVVLEWMQRKCGVELPATAWAGFNFEQQSESGRSVEAVAQEHPRTWASLLVAPESPGGDRSWIAETAWFTDGECARLAIRLGCAAHGDGGEFMVSVPPFVHALLQTLDLRSQGEAISAVSREITSGDEVDRLVELIETPQRTLPLIVVSETDPAAGSRYLLDTERLAGNLAGLALVYRIPFEAAYELTKRVDKQWSVFNGAVRTYRPGFARATQTPFEHPLIVGHRLAGDDNGAWAVERLTQDIARASVESADIYKRFPRFHDLRTAVIRQRTERQLKAETTAPARGTLLERQVEILQGQVEQALNQAVEAEDETRRTRADLEESRVLNLTLQARLEQLEEFTKQNNQAIPLSSRPGTYAELPGWIAENFPDRLVLSVKARRSLAASAYKDRSLVIEALELMAQHYVDMKRHGGRGEFEDRLRALKLKDEAVSATPAKLRNDQQYWCRHEGRHLFTDRHLKKGNSRDPQECLRIYYAWDETSRVVVIGHLTTHLESAIS